MKSWIVSLLCSVSISASAQCFGPGGCQPAQIVAPAELCFPDSCAPVLYQQMENFILATSKTPSGYSVMGWSGPCLDLACPEQSTQAYWDLWINARKAHRAQRAVGNE